MCANTSSVPSAFCQTREGRTLSTQQRGGAGPGSPSVDLTVADP